MSQRLAKKVVLIGWDAADWRVITPLLEAGRMPALSKLIDRGVMGNLATLTPPLSPLLWTSVATGMTADKHGVLGFTQPREDGSGIRPVLGTSRKVKALWNILHQKGMRSNVIGWWPSHPTEPIDGVMVSNFYPKSRGSVQEPTPPPPGSIHPPEAMEELLELRVHPGELTGAHVFPFAPFYAEHGADHLEPYEQNALNSIAKIIAETATLQSAATWAMESGDWDLTAIYFDAIDHIGHNFMGYHPPQMPDVPDDRFERFKHVVGAIYQLQDMMLERVVALAGEDATIIVISDHGFHADHLRVRQRPDEPAGPALEHRSLGIFCAAGPGIRKDERVYGASLLDIAPTILTLLGLPVGRDMDGRVLTSIFDHEVAIDRVDSWEDVEGDAAQHTGEALPEDPWGDQDAMEQLVALGYIDAPAEDGAAAIRTSRMESRHYLAQVYLGKDRPDLALPILEGLWREEQARRFGLHLIDCYQALGRFDEAHAILDKVVAAQRKQLMDQLEAAGGLESLPEGAEPIFPGLDLRRGSLFVSEKRYEEALPLLSRAEQSNPKTPSLPRQIGEAYLSAGQFKEAEAALNRSLELDSDQPRTLLSYAQTLLAQDRIEEAAGAATRAIGMRFFNPAGHVLLGDILRRLNRLERAAQAYEVALSQRPSHTKARFALAEVYRELGREADMGIVLSGGLPGQSARSAVVAQRPEDR